MESDITEIEVLQAKLKELEKENDYLKTLLQNAGIDYAYQNRVSDTESVFIPDQGSRIIPEEITRNHARKFFSYFWGRLDVYSYHKKWYPECFYLLAMLDTVSKENSIPLCDEYDNLRKQKLDSILFPDSVIALSVAQNSEQPKENAIREALPEFLKYNIVECEIRNVI